MSAGERGVRDAPAGRDAAMDQRLSVAGKLSSRGVRMGAGVRPRRSAMCFGVSFWRGMEGSLGGWEPILVTVKWLRV